MNCKSGEGVAQDRIKKSKKIKKYMVYMQISCNIENKSRQKRTFRKL
jgi:hypothetical protein